MRMQPAQTSYSRGYIEGVIAGSVVLYVDTRIIAISIENSWAAAFWSEGTSWCISEGSCFSDYRRLGPLILFRLLGEGRIYLLSPANCEFRNARNRRLCAMSFIKRFPKIESLVRSLICADWKASFYFEMVAEDARFEQSINLRGLGISALPNGLRIRDDLVLRGNPIRSLPENLFVGGNLDIRDTEIDDIPVCSHILGQIFRD